jgi:GNAT superfamily N-acetyltransferase
MSLLRHAWRYFRRQGAVGALRAMINRFVYRSDEWIVFRADLAGLPADDHVGDIVFRLATPSDLARLDELDRYQRGSSQRADVHQDHDWLFVAARGHRIVATRRYSAAVPAHGIMSRVLTLNSGQIWMADLFCLPEYRNQGVARLLAVFADRWLAACGYKEHFASVAVTNTASLRLSLRKGSEPFYHVTYFRLLFYERLRVSRDIPPGLA